ncbi:MAG: S49 family peptidase [Bauldia sp.]|nr:S49 family peptidase [Bauldia sp.]
MPSLSRRPVVPVVRLAGTIAAGEAFRARLNLASVAAPLDKAFAVRNAPAVAILINSPGGSPVQAHLIFRRIRALAAEKKKPVLAFVEDVAASGGYMIAIAGDEIIADPYAIVGSIGVVSAGFGFTGLMEKLGVERRMHTAGRSKAMLDPFLPEKRDDVKRLAELQESVHDAFIAMVKERRPGLRDNDGELFSGAFWLAPKARDFGLVDRLGDLRSVLRERYGPKVRLPIYGGRQRGLFRRWFSGRAAADLAAGSLDAMIGAIEDRALWRRYGL